MKVFLYKLTSRKFLLAVSTVAALLANKRYGEAVVAAMGYLGVEAHLDSKSIGSGSDVTDEEPV